MNILSNFSREQARGVKHGLKLDDYMLILDVGVGKTVVALTIIQERLDRFEITGALVVAPLRVCQAVWHREAAKWDHTKDLEFSLVWGSPADRLIAINQTVDVYLINYEGLSWLLAYCASRSVDGWKPPFELVVFDEVSRMSNPSGEKCKAWTAAMIKRSWIDYRIGMTATPATNGLTKLFGEYKCLDGGKSLGTGVEAFRHEYFYRSDYTKRYVPYGGAKERIFKKVRHMTYAVENKDINIPSTDRIIEVRLAPRAREMYDELEEQMFIQLADLEEVEVFNAAALANKLLQFANGSIYLGTPDDSPRRYSDVHDHKLEALDDLVEAMQGHPLLVGYAFKLDRRRIKARYPDLNVRDVHDYRNAVDLIQDFRNLDILTGHPASMAHGIDGLQDVCHHICWFGMTYDLELYSQMCGRLIRQGQKRHVYVHHIMVQNSIDQVVMSAIKGKAKTQRDFVQLLRDYSKEKM